jgi:hypothetical protein
MSTSSEGEREFAKQLSRKAREQLPQLDWNEVAPHLQIGWNASTHAERLSWPRVQFFARESWSQGYNCTYETRRV